MKKCVHFSRGRIHSCPADTARNQGSFTTHALLSVQSFLSTTVFTTDFASKGLFSTKSINVSNINYSTQGLRLCHLTPFDWKFLRIGTLRAKDLRKNVLILLKGGFTPAPLTLLAIRVVLLQKQAIVQRFLSLTVFVQTYLK